MYKEHLLENIRQEITLLKALATHVEESDLDFRPGEKVRTPRELMQYMSTIGAAMMRWLVKNDVTPEFWGQIRVEQQSLTLDNFAERMDAQLAQIEAYMAEVSEEDLLTRQVTLPNKVTQALGAAIMSSTLRWLATYRMQLFWTLKLNGKTHLSTREAWSVMG